MTLEALAAAAEQSTGKPARFTIRDEHPRAARGPLDIVPAQRDFGFAPQVDHREGIRKMVEAMLAVRS